MLIPRAVKIKRMIVYFNIENLLYGFFYRLYPGITKFNNFPRIGQDYVIMLPVKIRFFILCLILAKLVLAH